MYSINQHSMGGSSSAPGYMVLRLRKLKNKDDSLPRAGMLWIIHIYATCITNQNTDLWLVLERQFFQGI